MYFDCWLSVNLAKLWIFFTSRLWKD